MYFMQQCEADGSRFGVQAIVVQPGICFSESAVDHVVLLREQNLQERRPGPPVLWFVTVPGRPYDAPVKGRPRNREDILRC